MTFHGKRQCKKVKEGYSGMGMENKRLIKIKRIQVKYVPFNLHSCYNEN
jgi:hypothetical protein